MRTASTQAHLAASPAARLMYCHLSDLSIPAIPVVADAVADGSWAFMSPLTAYAPLAALAIAVTPVLTNSIINVYTGTGIFVVTACFGAILSGTVGVILLTGYLVGAVIVTLLRIDTWTLTTLFDEPARLFVGGLALAIPTLFIPRVARGFLPPIPNRLTRRPSTRIYCERACMPRHARFWSSDGTADCGRC
jgi:hypothetical protein